MSDNPPTLPARQPRSLFFILLPLAPIVVAIGIALAVKRYGLAPDVATSTSKAPGVQVGALAPDFSLPDVHKAEGDEPVTLSLAAKKSPVLLVFILGYNCERCTAHLRELDARLDEFEKAGVQIMAISPDMPANLRDSIQTFGDFHFPFLSDMDAKVARAYGLRDDADNPLHGLFLVDTHRRVVLSEATDHPYDEMDNVLEAARKLQGKK